MEAKRPRAFLVLFGVTAVFALANATRQLAGHHSPIARPLGLLSLLVAAASAAAWWGAWSRARWRFGAVVAWAASIVVAAAGGSVLMRPYMRGLWDVVPGPVVLTVLVAIAVYRARRR